MANYATRRLSDGLLLALQSSPNPPDEAGMLAKGVSKLGGVQADYELVTLTDQQALAAFDAMPVYSFLNNDTITNPTPPTFSLNKTQISADGVETVTLSVNCNDAVYSGNVYIRIRAGNGEPINATIQAVAGVVAETITTQTLGLHQLSVWTDKHGEANLQFEGVA